MPPFVRVCVGVFAITCVAVDGLWVVCRGHNLRTGCYWVSVVLPEPQPSLSSNDPLPPEDPRAHTHEHKSQATLRHASLMHPLLSLCFLTLPPLFSQCFPSCLVCVVLLSFQCNMSTHGQRGECWCVDPLTGVQIPETPKVRGDPNCNQFQEVHRAMPTAEASH